MPCESSQGYSLTVRALCFVFVVAFAESCPNSVKASVFIRRAEMQYFLTIMITFAVNDHNTVEAGVFIRQMVLSKSLFEHFWKLLL